MSLASEGAVLPSGPVRAVICPWAGRPGQRPCREAAEVLEEEASLCVRLSQRPVVAAWTD